MTSTAPRNLTKRMVRVVPYTIAVAVILVVSVGCGSSDPPAADQVAKGLITEWQTTQVACVHRGGKLFQCVARGTPLDVICDSGSCIWEVEGEAGAFSVAQP